MTYHLKRQPNGSYALYHPGLGETMHPGLGPWEEATRLYVQGSGLAHRLATGQGAQRTQELNVFDVGLGGAANALAALDCWQDLERQGARPRPLRVVSFEQDLAALAFTLKNAASLGYPQGHEPMLRELLEHGCWSAPPRLYWDLRRGDFAQLIQDEPARADLAFWDPFSPRSNPGMWNVAVLESLFRCRRPGGGLVLVTYSTAVAVRAALLLAGFYVGEGVRLAGGHASTVAAERFSDLAQPLDGRWLTRWRKDRDPWPPGTPPARHRALREALLNHPQWSQAPAAQNPAGHTRTSVPRQAKGSAPAVHRPPRGHRRWAQAAEPRSGRRGPRAPR